MTPGEQARLDLLEPKTRALVDQLIAKLAAQDFPVFVGSTRRTKEQEEQARLSGHSSANQTRSWHELGRAVDLRPRTAGGGPNYDTVHTETFYRALYAEATALGMRSLAYRADGSKLLLVTTHGTVWDSGHCEYRVPYKTLVEAIAAELPK